MPVSSSTFNKLVELCDFEDFDKAELVFSDEKIDVNDLVEYPPPTNHDPRYNLLQKAINKNCVNLVHFLLKKNPILTDDVWYETPLVKCLHSKTKIAVFKELLNYHRTNILVTSQKGESLLKVAFRKSCREKLKMILEHGALKLKYAEHKDYFHLCLAILKNDLKLVRKLVQSISDINFSDFVHGESPLFYAVYEDNLGIVKMLLRNGAMVNENKNLKRESALLFALKRESKLAIFKEILNTPKIDIEGTFGQGFYAEGMTDNFFNYEKINNVVKEMPIHLAARSGQLNKLKLLIKHGADVNCKTPTQKLTPLHVSTSHFKVIKLLLQNKADPNSLNRKGETPLHYCSRLSDFPTLKLLIEYGGNTTLVDYKGWTLLHSVAYSIHAPGDTLAMEIMEFLLKLGDINVNSRSSRGETPLHVTNKSYCHRSMLLLKYGADCNATATNGLKISFTKNCKKTNYKHFPDCQLVPFFKKLQLLGFTVDAEVADSLASTFLITDGNDIDEYQEEIRLMKEYTIRWNPRRTLYDILFMEKVKMTNKFANNEKLAELYEETGRNFENKFSAYGFLLNLHYRKCLRRKFLINAVQDMLIAAICDRRPVEACSEFILQYMTDYELKIMSSLDRDVQTDYD